MLKPRRNLWARNARTNCPIGPSFTFIIAPALLQVLRPLMLATRVPTATPVETALADLVVIAATLVTRAAALTVRAKVVQRRRRQTGI